MSTLEVDRDGLVNLEDLGDGTLAALRNEALLHGEKAFAAAIDQEIDVRANPKLFRHSRRRER